MASAQAKIDIVVKNLNSLNRLDKTLDKLNATNQSLISGIDKLTKSINNLSRAKGLDDISVSANRASASVEKVIDKTNVLQNLGRRARGNLVNAGIAGGMVGGGALAGGVLGGGAAINRSVGALNQIQRALHLGTTNVNGYAAAWAGISSTIKATAIPAIKLMGAAVMSNPVFGGIAAALLVTFGDKIWDTTKKIDGLGRSIFKIGQSAGNELQTGLIKASFGFKPIRTEIELTTQALLKLDERFKAPRGIITSRNRAFGIRQRGTAEEEEVRMRNRRINERASEAYSARFVRQREIQRGIEFKNLPTVKSYRAILAVEKKRLLIHQRNLRATEKLNMLAQAQGTTITGFSANQYGPQQAPPIPLTRIEQLGFGRRANPRGMFASRGGMGGRGRGAGSSALIGGAFPFLFGQGGASAAGGALGGAAGGFLGGGLGFGLSLVGTAIGSAIEKFDKLNEKIAVANGAMKAMGFESEFTRKEIDKMAKSLKITKDEAVQVASTFARFGKERALTLGGFFGADTAGFDAVAKIRDQASALAAIQTISKDISFEKQKELVALVKTNTAAQIQIKLQTVLLETQKIKRAELIKEIGLRERLFYWTRLALNLISKLPIDSGESPTERVARQLKELEEQFNKTKALIDGAMAEIGSVDSVVNVISSFDQLPEVIRKTQAEITKLKDPMFQVIEAATAISGAFSESFKGIIRGTMSVQEAFANMFSRIADHFADMAAQMAANQIKMGLLKMFANIGVSSLGMTQGANMSSMPSGMRQTGVGATANNLNRHIDYTKVAPFSSGGYVTRPTVGLVGEAGEDEYVIPASKMASSMQRYSAGARGDSVIAGGGSSYAGGGAGGSTTVNYSGPILNFNSEEFVPKSAVGQIIATATSQGARAGENRTLSTLRNSRSTRSRLGM